MSRPSAATPPSAAPHPEARLAVEEFAVLPGLLGRLSRAQAEAIARARPAPGRTAQPAGA